MTITTEEAERLAGKVDFAVDDPGITAAALRSIAAERDALQAENARLREALILARIAVSHACEDSGRLLYTQDLRRIDAALGEKE
jgi:hypothetical protein